MVKLLVFLVLWLSPTVISNQDTTRVQKAQKAPVEKLDLKSATQQLRSLNIKLDSIVKQDTIK